MFGRASLRTAWRNDINTLAGIVEQELNRFITAYNATVKDVGELVDRYNRITDILRPVEKWIEEEGHETLQQFLASVESELNRESTQRFREWQENNNRFGEVNTRISNCSSRVAEVQHAQAKAVFNSLDFPAWIAQVKRLERDYQVLQLQVANLTERIQSTNGTHANSGIDSGTSGVTDVPPPSE